MKKAKTSMRVLSVLMAALILMLCAIPAANAGGYDVGNEYNASQTLIDGQTGSLSNHAEHKYNFNVVDDSEILIRFENDTEGNYRVTVTNSDGDVEDEYSDWGYSANVFDLTEGVYTITIAEDSESADGVLDYKFSVIRRYNKEIKTTKVSLNKKKVKICKGNSFYLTAKHSPSNSTQDESWKSSNKKVCTVSSDGYVSAKNLGKATITYKHGSKKATCKVTVNHDYIQMAKGATVNLKKMVKYVKGYNSGKWSSSKAANVKVAKGKIKALKHGQATITAKIKGTKYKFKIYSYDKKVIKSKTLKVIKSEALKPKSVKVHTTLYPDFTSTKLYLSWKNAYGEKVNFYATGSYSYGSFTVRIYLGSYIIAINQ